jgi:predicted nucleic acid-binding Zn ribbon protein
MLPASSILSRLLPALLSRAPLTQEKLDFAWQTVVGASLARATRVRLHDGVLTVAADDARWTQEVERARTVVLERLRDLLGERAVRIVRIERS